MCAPIRDEKVGELSQTEGVVPTFRGILEVSHIPQDFISCTVNSWLSSIQASSIIMQLAKISKKIYHFCEVTTRTELQCDAV
jgi:hypothetical protein